MNKGIQWMREVQRHGESVPLDKRGACMAWLAICVGTTLDDSGAVERATQAIDLSDGQASRSVATAMMGRAMNRTYQTPADGADPALDAEDRRESAAPRLARCTALRHLDGRWPMARR